MKTDTRRSTGGRWLAILVLLFSGAAPAHPGSQIEGNGIKTVRALRAVEPPRLDGLLNDAIWRVAPPASGFVQKDPNEGEPASEPTEIRIVYTDTSIFFGVECYDSGPDKVIAREYRRDDDLEDDDSISIILDTFHDHRNAFLFRTNPLGAQFDALVTDEGKAINKNWDERWRVAASRGESGWSAEIEIPFKSLRLSAAESQIWGIDFQRVIRRKNEQVFWSNWKRGFKFEQVSQAGHLLGVEGIERGLRLRIKPYVKGGIGGGEVESGELSDIGLEDVKVRLTSGLTLDLTVNPDFAQTEVDEQRINLDRFPLFFPEKREFFLEGAGIFDVGINLREAPRGGNMQQDLLLFFSRRIGLSAKGETIPIMGGARLTGKVGNFSLGMLNIQTRRSGSEPETNFSVLRLKRELLSRSYIGGVFTQRRSSGGGDLNRVYGLDANFTFLRHLQIQGLLAKSETPGRRGNDWASSWEAKWDSDLFTIGAGRLILERNFNPELGFLERGDIKKTIGDFAFKPRPNISWIRQLRFRAFLEYITDNQDVLETKNFHYNFEINFQSGDMIRISPHDKFERLDRPFQIAPGVIVPAGDYPGSNLVIDYFGDPSRKLSGSFRFIREWGFFGGDKLTLRFGPRLRVNKNLTFNIAHEINDVKLPGGAFTSHVLNANISYSFNQKWLTSTIVQYNSTGDIIGVNFRLNFIFRPGDNFFLIYNHAREGLQLDGSRSSRALVAKLTYSFDF